MDTRKTLIRQRLGAEVARLRNELGMPNQPDLAARATVGRRTIVAVEAGDKVSSMTLRKIETALELDPGTIDAFLDGRIRSLGSAHEPPSRYPADLNDDPVERQLWDIDEATDDERWFLIDAYRVRRASSLREQDKKDRPA